MDEQEKPILKKIVVRIPEDVFDAIKTAAWTELDQPGPYLSRQLLMQYQANKAEDE